MRLTVYTSRAVHAFAQKDLINLRDLSSSVNHATGITGLLVYDGIRFIQALEGEAAAVRATMNRITRDPRHTSIVFVEDRDTTARQFCQWSTEYNDPEELPNEIDLLDRIKTSVSEVEDHWTKAAFIGFASLASRRWSNRQI